MAIRFIHAADIHLDSPLTGLAAYEGAPVELLRTATRAAFVNLVDSAIEQRVDFVVIAGDVYDGNWRDFNTGLFFVQQTARLANAGIRTVLLHGNHDAESELTKKLRLPDGVSTFGARRPETIRFDDLRIAFHGQSFATRDTKENLVRDYPEPLDGWFNIGVLHTALEGDSEHASYAPCGVAELRAKGYQYWALGHVHRHSVLSEDPFIVFPGNLQGRHVRETGKKGAVLVTVEDQAVSSIERVFVDVLRWEHLRIETTGCRSIDGVVSQVHAALDTALERAEKRPLAARISLTGRTPLHGEMFGDEASLRAEIQAAANGFGDGRVWIEKLRLETQPAFDEASLAARKDAVAELAGMLAEAASDPELISDLKRELEDVLAKLPAELRASEAPEIRALRDGQLESLVRELAPSILAQADKLTSDEN